MTYEYFTTREAANIRLFELEDAGFRGYVMVFSATSYELRYW